MNDLKFVVENLGDKVIERFRGKTIFLCGANGFLGRWFFDIFMYLNQTVLDNSCELISVDNNIVRKNSKNISFVLDICKEIDLSKFNINKIDYIINCAGIASPRIYKKYPFETLDVSYLGTKNILELGSKFNVSSILCFSSSEVYGTPDKDNIPTTEEYIGIIPTMSDRSCYDIGKKVLETLCHVYNEQINSPVKIIRPFNLYGPQMGLHDNRVLSNYISNIIRGESLKVYGNGLQTRTFCYVADAMVSILKLLVYGIDGQIYNVGNTKPEINIKELAQTVSNIFDNTSDVEIVDYPNFYPSDEPRRRCPDITKTISCIGYQPKINLKLGLKKMYDYYEEKL